MKTIEMNSLTLAYMGDAVIELYVRRHLIHQKAVKPGQLHQQAIHYVSAESQAVFLAHLIEKNRLSDHESAIIRRGRNAKSASKPKNAGLAEYKSSTAFEALIGYLYFENQHDRINSLMEQLFYDVEERRGKHEG